MTKTKTVRGWHVSVRYRQPGGDWVESGGYGSPEPAWRVGEEREAYMGPSTRPALCVRGYHAWLDDFSAALQSIYLRVNFPLDDIVLQYVEVSGYPKSDAIKVVGLRRKVLAQRIYSLGLMPKAPVLRQAMSALVQEAGTLF